MNKKLIFSLLVSIIFLLLSINNVKSEITQFYDGDYTNGGYINLTKSLRIFVQGHIDKVKYIVDVGDEYSTFGIKFEIISENLPTTIKTVSNNKLTIKRKGNFSFRYYKGKEISQEESFFSYNKKYISLLTEHNGTTLYITPNTVKLTRDELVLLYLENMNLDNLKWLEMRVNNGGSLEWVSLNYATPPLGDGFIKFDSSGNFRSSIIHNSKYLLCPENIKFINGGEILVRDSSFTVVNTNLISLNDPLINGIEGNFRVNKPIVFKIEKLNKDYACVEDLDINIKDKNSNVVLREIKGRVLKLNNDEFYKIEQGKIKIDGIYIKGKNFYLLNTPNFDRFKETNVVYFDEETGTLTFNDNFSGFIYMNGQQIKFEKGNIEYVTTKTEDLAFYELLSKEKQYKYDIDSNWDKAINFVNDAKCEDMGGEWKDESEVCGFILGNTYYAAPQIGKQYNELSDSKPKIIDYVPGKKCCVKYETIPISKIIIKSLTDDFVSVETLVEVKDGRNIFKFPEGSIIVDVAPQFLKDDIERVKKDVFDVNAVNKIPNSIKVQDLLLLSKWDKRVLGFYVPETREIKIKRPEIFNEAEDILVHEILHHFYYTEKSDFFNVFRRYINDDSLDEKQERTRRRLFDRLQDWKNYYNPANEEEWLKKMSIEGYSVIGEWLYLNHYGFFGYDVKFPEYILNYYKGILKSNIVNEGKN